MIITQDLSDLAKTCQVLIQALMPEKRSKTADRNVKTDRKNVKNSRKKALNFSVMIVTYFDTFVQYTRI